MWDISHGPSETLSVMYRITHGSTASMPRVLAGSSPGSAAVGRLVLEGTQI